jgi:hypothetical protein
LLLRSDPKANPLQIEIENPLARESIPKSFANQESKIPWEENGKGILVIAILLFQIRNPKSLDTTRLNPVISDFKPFFTF